MPTTTRGREPQARLGLAFGVLANLIGSSTFLVTKWALDGWPPATLISVRTFVAVVLFALTWPRGGLEHATRADWARLVIIGTFGLGVPHVIAASGLVESESLVGALLVGLEPITIVLASVVFLGERLRAAQLMGIALGLIGATLVISRGETRVDVLSVGARGAALLALASALWGVYTVAAKPTLERVTPRALTAVTSVISFLFVLPFSAAEWGTIDPAQAFAPRPLASAIALGALVSFGCASLWNAALRRLPASDMAVLVFIQPIAGAGVAFLAGEHLPNAALAGGALVLLGVYLAERRRPSSSSTEPRSGRDEAVAP